MYVSTIKYFYLADFESKDYLVAGVEKNIEPIFLNFGSNLSCPET